jgi:WD40 repeat protein
VGTLKLRHELASDEKVRAVAFSKDGKNLATGGQTIALWNTQNGEKIRTVQQNLNRPQVTGPAISTVEFSSDDRILISGTMLGSLQVLRALDGKLLRSIAQPLDDAGFPMPVRGMVLFPNERRVATLDLGVYLWDLDTSEMLANWEASGGSDGEPGRPLALSPDGRTIAYERRVELEKGSRLEAVLHNTSNLKPPRPLNIGDNSREQFSAVSFAFAPSGRVLATGAADNSVRLWNVETKQELKRFTGHVDRVSYVDFSPDGELLASTSWDGTVLIWDVDQWSGKKP